MKCRLGLIIISIAPMSWAATTDQVLKSAWSDPAVKVVNDHTHEITSNGSSLFRQGQVFYAREQDYKKDGAITHEVGLKLQPFSLAERRVQKQQESKGADMKKVQLGRALLDRYQLLIQYVQTAKKVDLLKQVSETAMKNFRTHLLASQIGRSDARKIVKARLDWARMQRELKETEILKNQYGQQLKDLVAADLGDITDANNWVTPVGIQKKLTTWKAPEAPLSYQMKKLEVGDIEAEQELTRGRRYALIDSLEVAYSRPETADRDSSVEFKISFNIPWLGNHEETAIKNRDYVSKSVSATKELSELKSLYRATMDRLKDLLEVHSQLSGFLNNGDLTKKAMSVDPQLGLETLFETLTAKSEYLDLERDILLNYVQLVFESGQLVSSPETNYLAQQENKI